jgi:N utilization substance protein A
VGDDLVFPLEAHDDFGRIAAQTAKQVVLQKLRESERDSILNEWKGKEGTIVSGLVQRFERGNVYIDLGRTIGVMFAAEAVPNEHYRQGQRMRFLVLAVQEDTRLPGIILSRAHPRFVSKLFELEVPELADGSCEIKMIAREAGSRTKIAVASSQEGVDPVGAFVGQRGTRVMAVNNELGTEKIDIIEYSEDPNEFIAHSLSPAKVQEVEILPRREARVYVADDQLSLAIGRGGQNVRLAAKLTGWKIDVRSQSRPEQVQEEGVSSEDDAEGATGTIKIGSTEENKSE